MRVKFRSPSIEECPERIEPYARAPALTPGREYEAHSVSVFDGVAAVLVMDDHNFPGWKPTWLFETVDGTIPDDWRFYSYSDWPELVVGPDFIAGSQEAYASMVELDAAQVARLKQRIQDLGTESEESS